ncbi:MAG: type II secretion system F family protein [Gammaproteobacteria bacterium]|jgi:type IV pilus assembly protein PilC|nr:type II secretion system F family protein [Gammaproteobacteria bacterium]MBT3859970.1 type II secretion system F family protein [Gammaproteobacteria bacterium]MBT3986432.1 type II secretion system F family protein [Gammaproteobacteria bacterium]MBT4254818.1 type II secretion system F family protein [Gammaproteobacteria bacterium]MBT4582992.1 type II secretion system F family protein [Gammaproteobacteria bacterium]
MATEAAQSLYTWQGTDKAGNKTKGEIQGSSQALVKAQLRKQGVNPTRVRRKGKDLFGPKKQAIKPQDIAVFTRQLATMMKSGIPLVQSFEIVGETLENPSMRQLVLAIRDDIAAGNNFADCIRKHPRYFDDLFCNLVDAGEQSGALETMLDRLATYKEKSEALKSKIKKAMNYPIGVVCVAIVVTGILLVKVVPQFAVTFSSFGAELPAFTLLVLNLSDIAIAHWWKVIIGIGVFGYTFKELKFRSKAVADAVDRISLKIPIVGPILNTSCYARFTRTLSTTFSAGVPLVDALESVAGATGNIVYSSATRKIRDDVTTGQQLNFAIKNTTLFPVMITQMVGIGEESGALDSMLDKCAVYYEAEVDNAVDGLTALMEPMIMAVLAVLVGGLMIAMYLPIFQLGAVM